MTDDRVLKGTPESMVRNRSDVAPIPFPWGEIQWLVNGSLDPGAEMTFGTVTIRAGERNDLHMHPNCEEVIYVVEGECRHRIGNDELPMTAGSALRIPRGVWHCATAGGTGPCTMVIAYSSPDRQTIISESDG